MIAGLYPYTRGGVEQPPVVTLAEIPESLKVNPTYRDLLTVYAGNAACADVLRWHGLHVHRVMDDAPDDVKHDMAHRMKHWMCRCAMEEFGEFLWVDWDAVMLRSPDADLWDWCRYAGTPKFIHIPGYHATVNCGVYYAPHSWKEAMDRSFGAVVVEPNDELLWRSELPEDVVQRKEFWLGERAVNVWTGAEMRLVTRNTYFAHTRHLSWASPLRARHLDAKPAW